MADKQVEAKQVEVRALQDGHDGVQYRYVGERFFVDEARTKDGSTWFEPVDPPDDEKPAKKSGKGE